VTPKAAGLPWGRSRGHRGYGRSRIATVRAAKAQLSRLRERAAAGKEILITSSGGIVATRPAFAELLESADAFIV